MAREWADSKYFEKGKPEMRPLRSQLLMLLSCFALGCFTLGCSGVKAPPLFSVTGKLVVGGKPLDNITVQLIPFGSNLNARPGIGKTDKDGMFTILTNGEKGATAGTFKVVLLAPTPAAPTGQMSVEEATKMSGQYVASGGPPRETTLPFPAEWADPGKTPKELEVVDKPVTLNIEI